MTVRRWTFGRRIAAAFAVMALVPNIEKLVVPFVVIYGISFFFTSPAPLGNEVVPGGRLNTTQCHQPLPVGASGS